MTITEFPPEILLNILQYNDSLEYYMIRATCKHFRQIIKMYFPKMCNKSNLLGACSISVVIYLQEHHCNKKKLLMIIMSKCSVEEWKDNYHHSFMKSNDDINDLYLAAAAVGNISILKYLMTLRRPKTSLLVEHACRYDQIECLKYLKNSGFEIQSNSLRNAIANNSVNCARYILDLCPVPINKFKLADGTIGKAASKGYTECFDLLLNHGYRVTDKDLMKIASKGKVDLLKSLVNKGRVITPKVIESMTSHIDSLKYLKESNLRWDQYVMESSIKNGNLKCIQYCVEQGLQLTTEMMNLANKPTCRKYIASILGL